MFRSCSGQTLPDEDSSISNLFGHGIESEKMRAAYMGNLNLENLDMNQVVRIQEVHTHVD